MKTEAAVIEEESEGQEPPMGGSRGPAVGRLADPEVTPKVAKRKRWPTSYKLRIAEEAEACKHRKGELSALARREGLYSCTLSTWMQWRHMMREKGFDVTQGGKRAPSLRNDLKRLERENERLKAKLRRAEGLIELQKKVSRLLEELSACDPSAS